LLDREALSEVERSYTILSQIYNKGEKNMPTNAGKNNVWRNLDCAVIEHLHHLRKATGLTPYDTVRGLFGEGEDLYPNAGMRKRNHVQIAVRNKACIKGYFRPFV